MSDGYTPQMKQATLAMIDHKLKVAGMPTYTELRTLAQGAVMELRSSVDSVVALASRTGVKHSSFEDDLAVYEKAHKNSLELLKEATP